jgi:hypothetical protein
VRYEIFKAIAFKVKTIVFVPLGSRKGGNIALPPLRAVSDVGKCQPDMGGLLGEGLGRSQRSFSQVT